VTHRVHVAVRPPEHRGHDTELRVAVSGLDGLDSCLLPSVFGALASYCGLDHEAMSKAVRPGGGEPPDPRYPEITKLIEHAWQDWTKWGQRLIDEVVKLLEQGKLLPMDAAAEQRLSDLLSMHETAWLHRVTGRHIDRATIKRLSARKLIDPSRLSYIEAAFRLGRSLPGLETHRLPSVARERAPVSQALKEVAKLPLTRQDREAMAYVRRRGYVYMRRPVATATREIDRVLSDAEYKRLRGTLDLAVERRKNWQQVRSDLSEAVAGTTLTNDLRRVARTELMFAHNQGAAESLRTAAAAAGDSDPTVFKLVSPGACDDCRRIWGPLAAPRRYKLSEIEARNGGSGNFGLPRRLWGPTIGPVHPNCTEGPLQYWAGQKAFDRVKDIADAISRTEGGGRFAAAVRRDDG